MESGQNDSPIADSIAYLESQGVPTDDEDEDDIHFCKKCQQVFKKLGQYLEHKIKHDKFKVAYNRAPGDRRMVLPTLRKKETPEKRQTSSAEGDGKQKPDVSVRPRKRRKKKDPPVDVELIAERNTYVCTTCDRKFSREASLKWHVQYDHNKTEGDSEEEEEEKGGEAVGGEDDRDISFKVKEPPIKRVRVSGDDDRPFKCDVCDMTFKEVAVLKTHMLTHSNVRQFRCSYGDCPYAFKTKGSLVRHMRRHTGERPYSCESCGRRFAESGALTRHMRSRKPCTMKSDADLPRYGKKWTYVPNIPAVVSQDKGEGDDAFVSMVPGEMVVVVTEGENGEQILTEAQVVSNNETVSSLGETVPVQMEEGEVGESEVGELLAASECDDDDQTLTSTQCKVCREECVEVEALRAHLRLHLADFPFHCGFCHFTTEDRHDLRDHLQSKHLQELKGIDPSVLLPPSGNRTRRDTAHPTRDNKEARTAVQQLLKLPVTLPAEDGVADTCSTRVISRCPICNRAFRGSSYLKQHMKSHAGDRPYECPVCGKSFVTKDSLNKHLIVHTDERNYKCGVCHKLFKRIAHVREHLKIHSADRPFPCSVCDKAFKTNNALKVHLRTHSNCYPYECRVCHRHFREKGSMQRHMRTHTGERPFVCVRCGRGFAEHGTLSRHLKAKVQCVQYQRVEGVEREESVEMQMGGEEEEGAGEGDKGEGEGPTVLAEFSSVVADTQRYIVADHLAQGDTQTTEYVVLHTDLGGEDLPNVHIVTEGDIDPETILSTVAGADQSFVVVSQAGDRLHIIDSSTGLTLATMADHSAAQPLTGLSQEEGASVEGGDVSGVGEVVGSEVEEGSTITVLTDSSGHIILRQQDSVSLQQDNSSLQQDSVHLQQDSVHLPQDSAVLQQDEVQDSVVVVSDIADAVTLQAEPGTANTITHTDDTITHTEDTVTHTADTVTLEPTAGASSTIAHTGQTDTEAEDSASLRTTELPDSSTLQTTTETANAAPVQILTETSSVMTTETVNVMTTDTVNVVTPETETAS